MNTDIEKTIEENAEKLEELNERFEQPTIWKRLVILFTGLKKPRKSREYKEAMVELQRLSAPLLAFLIPVIAIAILVVCATPDTTDKTLVNIRIAEVEETVDDLSDTPDDLSDAPLEMTDVVDDFTMESDVAPDVVNPAEMLTSTAPAPKTPTVDAVMTIKSPVTFKPAFGDTRTAAARARSLRNFGGDKQTEAAVLRALRWLKTRQNKDGSWPGASGADGMRPTGLVILTFLSHGEKPGATQEFGETVQRGVQYLMNQSNLDAAEIHALAESFGMSRNPNIKTVVEKKLNEMADRIADTEWGPPRDGSKAVLPRLLPMTFQTMALRSAKLSHFKLPNMEKALANLKVGLLNQANLKTGGFSDDHWGPPRANYRRTGTWHFMVGVVAMQYLGASKHAVIEKTLQILDDDWEPPTLETTDIACCPVRGNYWATMVFFNAGGKRWANWNRDMKGVYVGGQKIIRDTKYTDPKGRHQDIGYWTCEDMHISGNPAGREIITTCYVAQQLMVYYRYLPTSKSEAWNADEEKPTETVEKDDVEVRIDDL